MHETSFNKMRHFAHTYLSGAEGHTIEIIDIGARAVNGAATYRNFFSKPGWRYRGLDTESGDNVDIIVKDPYNWKCLESSSMDVVISGQAFEHIEFPWRTLSEIYRVLRPGGIACIITPSSGPEHRFPVDCWRIYPDGIRALARHAGLRVVEVFTDWGLGNWQDTFAVMQKPKTETDNISRFPLFEDRGVARSCYAEIKMESSAEEEEFGNLLKTERIEFFDFGCSSGGSLAQSKKDFNVKGIGVGIDTDPKKVKMAREAGHRAFAYDILKIPAKKTVRFTVMSHFLEHIHDLNLVSRFIVQACKVSSQFVLIRQPFFDADGYLMQKGLKLYWSHWHGHPNTLSSLQLYKILSDLRARDLLDEFSIHHKGKIESSADKRIHPISSPIDQHDYDSSRHPQKNMRIHFNTPVFCETYAFISMRNRNHYDFFKRIKVDATIFESDGLKR